MKKYLSYDEFVSICDEMADKIVKLAETKNKDIELVAITRGGVTAAHRIAYKLGLPLNFWSPTLGLAYPLDNSKTSFLIEDLIAKGRTLDQIKEYFRNSDYEFCPVLVDEGFATKNSPLPFSIWGFVSKDWIVFPYEDFDKVREGDWGLFRQGTSESAKPLVERNK